MRMSLRIEGASKAHDVNDDGNDDKEDDDDDVNDVDDDDNEDDDINDDDDDDNDNNEVKNKRGLESNWSKKDFCFHEVNRQVQCF